MHESCAFAERRRAYHRSDARCRACACHGRVFRRGSGWPHHSATRSKSTYCCMASICCWRSHASRRTQRRRPSPRSRPTSWRWGACWQRPTPPRLSLLCLHPGALPDGSIYSDRPVQSTAQPASDRTDGVVRVTAETLNRLVGLAGEQLMEARHLKPFVARLHTLLHLHRDVARALDQCRDALPPPAINRAGRSGDAIDEAAHRPLPGCVVTAP